jgi:hypothetical protein
MTPEQKRILDNMLSERIASISETDADEVQTISDLVTKGLMDPARLRGAKSPGEIEAEAIRQILLTTYLHNQKEDDLMSVGPNGTMVDVRSIRVWASFYRTPEVKQ